MKPEPFTYQVLELRRILDGDSVEIIIDLGFFTHRLMSIRLAGIDAPEIRGSNKKAGFAAKAHLESLLAGQSLIVTTKKQDKYGRWLGTFVTAAGDGRSINQRMIDDGHARPYSGGKR